MHNISRTPYPPFTMTKSFIFLFIVFPFLAIGQNNLPLGQGVLKIDYTKLPTLRFFEDTLHATPVKTISIAKDKEGEYIIKNQKKANAWFMPEQISLEYDIFIIRVDTVIGKWYRVVTNTEKATMLWTKVDPVKKFIKWPTFLLKETTAIEKGFADLEIKAEPSEKARTIKKIEVKDCFEVLEIKGDWMKIRTNTILDCNESQKPIKSGWIKWRQNNRLTIAFGLTC